MPSSCSMSSSRSPSWYRYAQLPSSSFSTSNCQRRAGCSSERLRDSCFSAVSVSERAADWLVESMEMDQTLGLCSDLTGDRYA